MKVLRVSGLYHIPSYLGSADDILVLALALDQAVRLHGTLDAIHGKNSTPIGRASKACSYAGSRINGSFFSIFQSAICWVWNLIAP